MNDVEALAAEPVEGELVGEPRRKSENRSDRRLASHCGRDRATHREPDEQGRPTTLSLEHREGLLGIVATRIELIPRLQAVPELGKLHSGVAPRKVISEVLAGRAPGSRDDLGGAAVEEQGNQSSALVAASEVTARRERNDVCRGALVTPRRWQIVHHCIVHEACDSAFRLTSGSLVSPSSPDPPTISVIIPVRDNPGGVREVLACLDRQTIPREQFEVVIGDDGSEAGSLAGIATVDRHVCVVSGSRKTSYAARNHAVTASRGSFLAFCDSDCHPAPTWLEEGIAALHDADLAAGEVLFNVSALNVWSLLTVDMFFDQARNVRLSRAVTANLFTTRRVFDAAGGFDESLPSGGDYDFVSRCLTLGAILVHAPAAVVTHPTLPAATAFLRKVWWTNRWLGVRGGRDPGRMRPITAIEFIPIIGPMIARRRALRPLVRLARDRIASSGIVLRRHDELAAIAMLYLLVAPVAAIGRVQGMLEGSRSSVAPVRYRNAPSDERVP